MLRTNITLSHLNLDWHIKQVYIYIQLSGGCVIKSTFNIKADLNIWCQGHRDQPYWCTGQINICAPQKANANNGSMLISYFSHLVYISFQFIVEVIKFSWNFACNPENKPQDHVQNNTITQSQMYCNLYKI